MSVFISYRRDDSAASAGRLYETLGNAIGSELLFKDVDNVGLGLDFRDEVERAIRRSQVLIAVVGPNWGSESGLHRLNTDGDYVRQEIALALDHNLTVLPVLVDGAELPSPHDLPADIRPMIFRNAAVLEHDTWSRDVQGLIEAVRSLVDTDATLKLHRSEHQAPALPPHRGVLSRSRTALGRYSTRQLRRVLLGCMAIAGLLIVGGVLLAQAVGDQTQDLATEDSAATTTAAGAAAEDLEAPPDLGESETESSLVPLTVDDTAPEGPSSSDSTALEPTTTEAARVEPTTTTSGAPSTTRNVPSTTQCSSIVPDVLGATVGEAASAIGSAGLIPATQSVPNTNLVTGTNPSAGASVCAGSEIRFESCSSALVPHLVFGVDQVETELVRAGLALGSVSREFNENSGKDVILRTSPESGARVCSGSEVNIVVSDGPPPCFSVPDVRGMVAADAANAIRAADSRLDVGLDFGFIEEGQYEIDEIFWQWPIGNVFDCERTDYLRVGITAVGGFVP